MLRKLFLLLALTGCGGLPVASGTDAGSAQPTLPGVRSGSSAEQVLYSFTGGTDGGDAAAGIVVDAQGDLYGTTVIGGAYTCGTVFELTPQPSPPWPETVLHSFGCYADGKSPYGGVSFDPHGNLDGTTVSGGTGGYCGSDGCGIVYQLTPGAENVLHDFTGGNDGFGPGGGVAFDKAGNAYGTTPDGGAYSRGIVYEVLKNGPRHERVLHAFTGGKDGAVGSLGLLLVDSSRNLYGVTEIGGAHNAGTVFELSPVSKGGWKLTTLYAFKGTPDAASPYGGLLADASGNLYGTTYYGGTNGLGTVFALTRSGGRYRERVLYSFKGGSDGSSPTSTLNFGSASALYGTTSAGGGACGCGTIFQVSSKTGRESLMHAFAGGADGAYPYYGLTKGASGEFYGTTVEGGDSNQGTVFALSHARI